MRTRCIAVLSIVATAMGCGGGDKDTQVPIGSSTVVHAQLKTGGPSVPFQGAVVALDFFTRARIQPLLGRFFIEGDEGGRKVVVLSHDAWTGRFASSPGVIGRTIEIDGDAATIVGVAPPGFSVPDGTQFWAPMSAGRS